MIPLDAGKLRLRIAIQEKSKSSTVSSSGINISVWTDVAGCSSVPASMDPIKGKEYFQAAAEIALNRIPISIRYRSGITAAMQVLYGSRIFNIRNVIDVEERHVKLLLMCEEVANGN